MNTRISSRRSFLRYGGTGLVAIGAASFVAPVLAQSPVEHLRILVGFAPGAAPDVMARAIAAQLSGSYPRGAIVENRTGGNGVIAVNALKAAPADGSTVLMLPASGASVTPCMPSRRMTRSPI